MNLSGSCFCTGWHHFSCHLHKIIIHLLCWKLIKHFLHYFTSTLCVVARSLQCLLCQQIYGEFFMMLVGDEMGTCCVLCFLVSLRSI